MSEPLLLLAVYGLCFVIKHKLPFLYSTIYLESLGSPGGAQPSTFIDRLLHCTFCLGFHCGWLVWVARCLTVGASSSELLWAPGWALAGAGGCYLIDALAQRIEP